MDTRGDSKRVAIACQGGGSHTAFTAGALKRLLRAEELVNHGEARAEEFLAALAFEDAWRGEDPDAVMGFFAEDTELVSSAPFPGRGPYKGRARIRSFVTEHLAEGLRMDLTKKQVARDGAAWTVRSLGGGDPSARSEGVAEAQFRGGKITTLHLGDGTRPG